VPLALKSPFGLVLPVAFAIGASLPVVVLSALVAAGSSRLGKVMRATQSVEKVARYVAGLAILGVGIYYSKNLFS